MRQETFTILFLMRKGRTKKNGLASIYARITTGSLRQEFYFHCEGKEPPSPSNLKMNANMEGIVTVCDIDKEVTTDYLRHIRHDQHTVARHPSRVTSRMLGHTNVKTLQIYAKVTDNMPAKGFEEMAGIYSEEYSLIQ